MKIGKLTLELTESDAHSLRELIEGFHRYQLALEIGEGSPRTRLANRLLKVLPQSELIPEETKILDAVETVWANIQREQVENGK